jgi:AraC-like DNA-binding protein
VFISVPLFDNDRVKITEEGLRGDGQNRKKLVKNRYYSHLKAMGQWHLHITGAYRAFCAKDWYWKNPPAKFTGYNLWFVAQGRGSLATCGKKFVLRPGLCFLLRMWEAIDAKHDPGHPLVVPYILFDVIDNKGKSHAQDDVQNFPLMSRCADPGFMDNLLERIVMEEGKLEGQSRMRIWLEAALMELRREQESPSASEKDFKLRALIDETCSEMRARPERKWKISELAIGSGYSVDHFIRRFRNLKGITPKDFLLAERMNLARNLLRFSGHSVERIAGLCGFSDLFSFSKAFKKRTGVSPRDFRGRV